MSVATTRLERLPGNTGAGVATRRAVIYIVGALFFRDFSVDHPPPQDHPADLCLLKMTRGNQRELAREKTLKKQQGQKHGTQLPDGMTLAQKKIMDAEIMRQKQAKAADERQQQPKTSK